MSCGVKSIVLVLKVSLLLLLLFAVSCSSETQDVQIEQDAGVNQIEEGANEIEDSENQIEDDVNEKEEPCCQEPELVEESGSILLESPTAMATTKVGEQPAFHVVLKHDLENVTEVMLTVETTEGAEWSVAVCCDEEECFKTDGSAKMEQKVKVGDDKELDLEIKVLVSPSATSGEYKFFTVGANDINNPELSSFLEFQMVVE